MTNELPYDFDLLHDIKTTEELHGKFHDAVQMVNSLQNLAQHHNIFIPMPTPDKDEDEFQPFDHESAKVMRCKVRPGKPVEIKVTGNRDQRGPDNSVMVWVDENDKLHIRTWKAKRCYQFDKVIETDGCVEVVAK